MKLRPPSLEKHPASDVRLWHFWIMKNLTWVDKTACGFRQELFETILKLPRNERLRNIKPSDGESFYLVVKICLLSQKPHHCSDEQGNIINRRWTWMGGIKPECWGTITQRLNNHRALNSSNDDKQKQSKIIQFVSYFNYTSTMRRRRISSSITTSSNGHDSLLAM